MNWTFISPEVYRENGDYVIPYVRGNSGGGLDNRAIDMFESVSFVEAIEFELAVNREYISILENSLPLFNEYAVFICDDWKTWLGQEIGFRFPLHLGKSWCTAYVQHPFGGLFWMEVPIHVKDIEEFHTYSIDLQTYGKLKVALCRIDGNIKAVFFMRNNKRSPYLPVLCAHNNLKQDYSFTLKVRDVRRDLTATFI